MKMFNLTLSGWSQQIRDETLLGIEGFAVRGPIAGHPSAAFLFLASGRILKLKAETFDFSDQFECTTLMITSVSMKDTEDRISLECGSEWKNVCKVRVLERFEWTEKDAGGDTVGNSSTIQMTGRFYKSDSRIIDLCRVQAGLLITNKAGHSVAVYADGFPYSVNIVADRGGVAEILKRHGFAPDSLAD